MKKIIQAPIIIKAIEDLKEGVFETIFNYISVSYYWMDKEGYLLGCNQKVLDALRVPSLNAFVGKHASELVSKSAWKNSEKVMKTGKVLVAEEIHTNRNGTKTYYLSVKSPILNDQGQVLGLAGVSIDITAQKQSDMMKQTFIDSVYHDIQSPFFTLRILPEAMAKDEADPKRKENLMMISQCANRLSNYLGRVMDIATTEDKSAYDQKSDVNVRDVIEGTIAIVKPLINQKGLKISFTIENKDDAGNESIYIQKLGLEQVLINLVTNAAKFTEKGGIKIEAIIKKNVLHLSVIDTGIGIPEKYQEIIFEKFQRVIPSNLEPEYKGSGMGLAILKKLVYEIMYGDIALKSVPQKGSTFKVRLPVLRLE